jgi:hypothetical protein
MVRSWRNETVSNKRNVSASSSLQECSLHTVNFRLQFYFNTVIQAIIASNKHVSRYDLCKKIC